jgi:dolichyl-phosphate-mannose--protein O-mannosyl transferase
MAHFGDPNVVRYGVPIKLRHVLTGHVLHSHLINYVTGSHQQEVTCFGSRDDNDWFSVRGPHGNGPWNCNIGTPVLNHAVIRLGHLLTGKLLHSHNGVPSPATHQQEVTCHGEHFEGDDNDNWRLEVEGEAPGQPWLVTHRLRLIHVLTNHSLHSHAGHNTASHQQEVTAYDRRDDNDWWIIDVEA